MKYQLHKEYRELLPLLLSCQMPLINVNCVSLEIVLTIISGESELLI